MKTLMLVLSIIFAILCFCGCGYIFYMKGNASAGYACVPMVLELVCISIYKKLKKTEDK